VQLRGRAADRVLTSGLVDACKQPAAALSRRSGGSNYAASASFSALSIACSMVPTM